MSRFLSRVAPSALTFLLWMSVAASLIAWGLKIRYTKPSSDSATPISLPDFSPTPAGLARGLGGGAQKNPVADTLSGNERGRFSLVGVVASPAGHGVALISVDGKPARPFRLGGEVADGWIVEKLAAKSAVLAFRETQGGGKLEISLPARQARS